MLRIFNDMIIPFRFKGKLYRTVVRPDMIYESKCRAVNRKIEYIVIVAKMKILIWRGE